MLEIGKFYTNVFGNKFKCLEIIYGKVVFWVLKELPENNGLVALKKDGQREPIRTISLVMIQDIKYASQYKAIESPEEIERVSKIYERQTFETEMRLRQKEGRWLDQYKIRRYFEHLNTDELKIRLIDILTNAYILSDNDKLVLRNYEGEGEYWLAKLVHIEEEYRLRRLSYPEDILKQVNLPKFNIATYCRNFITCLGEVLKPGTFIIKYGESKFMKQLFEEGAIHIKPASKFEDPTLKSPIRDNELSKTIYGIPSEVKMEVFDHKTGKSRGELVPTSNITYTSESSTDYYVYCVSCIYDPRIFKDRGCNYDSCVVIKQPFEFERKLEKIFKEVYPDWVMFKNLVEYVDPFNAKDNRSILFFTKHFSFTYQHEFRFIWLPPLGKTAGSLEPLDLNLGSLKDIAEFVVL